jgi:excinuclease ABC subunit C
MIKFDYKTELPKLPDLPGVYRYFDEEDTVIYVGKAKSLKNRVSSYFNNYSRHDRKTKRLVDNIRRLEYTIVPTEYDALLLENTLIKKFQPKFNILLRDDKTYPYVVVTNERFPRLEITRRMSDKNKGKMFGPFVYTKPMYALMDMFRQLYSVRSCNLNLSEENVKAGKYKVCLEFHLKNCKAPCVGYQTEEDYDGEIEQVQNILKGNLSPAKQFFFEQIQQAVEKLSFEDAHVYKQKLEFLDSYQSKATVVNPSITNVDVFAIVSDEENCFVTYLKVSNGTITATDQIEIKKKPTKRF